ncbi:DUF3107 domain-containing protein [Cellulomonas sp. zg-ZUI222]|uniref:DUF3107 domain-containing protein n=1 Tax=Cellulomonas wangleii TaxID=2816956 RepID=A0ABX8D1E7_9CELL|nr:MULTISPECIES: DUF3107 domain-containing protein [Cellulomonas]MBO0899818.1 DUF3107 domain-containing protein [Cellulomonas sp. zg-ZUI22]MBO0920680.1 DUF3107 domain-containing protein [Cellulomonas wangleii]MBO0922902.1 DUF3107 domain-containing protein [Cellulomonas wangleii]QVI61299.1 DUF3107 domain-containing protein [Cellulomonas wangleii]
MEITIGVQHLSRELTLESDQTADEIATAVRAALDGTAATLELTDVRGRRVVVPTAVLGFVEIGAETKGRVGFGTI